MKFVVSLLMIYVITAVVFQDEAVACSCSLKCTRGGCCGEPGTSCADKCYCYGSGQTHNCYYCYE